MSVWPLMEHQRISQPSSLHKADSLLHTKSATLRRLQNSLVYQHICHPEHTEIREVKYLFFHSYLFVFLHHSASTLSLDLQSGVLLAVPIPEEHAAAGQLIEEAIQAAVTEARYRKSLLSCCFLNTCLITLEKKSVWISLWS